MQVKFDRASYSATMLTTADCAFHAVRYGVLRVCNKKIEVIIQYRGVPIPHEDKPSLTNVIRDYREEQRPT